MAELKKLLNIRKINAKNIFLLILVLIVISVLGVITKLMPGKAGKAIAGINQADAQTCWNESGATNTACDTECGGEGGAGEGGAGEGGGCCCGDGGSI